MKAVLDQIIDGKWAVLLVGETEIEYKIAVEKLPVGAREGMLLNVRLENEAVVRIEVLAEATALEQARLSDKLAILKKRKNSIFKEE